MDDSEFLARLVAMAAEPKPETISLPTLHEVALFRSLPIEQRKRINVWLGKDVPLWNGNCVRCEGPLQYANESYGTRTYTRCFRCPQCGWRDEQPTNDPAMHELLSEMHRQDDLEKQCAITDQAAFPEILERGDDVFLRAPIRAVELLDAGPHIKAILRSPHLSRLVGLGLEARWSTTHRD